MSYHSQQLPNQRWGIFVNNELVASIGCADTCDKIVDFLKSRLSEKNNSSVINGAIIEDEQVQHLQAEFPKISDRVAESSLKAENKSTLPYFKESKIVA